MLLLIYLAVSWSHWILDHHFLWDYLKQQVAVSESLMVQFTLYHTTVWTVKLRIKYKEHIYQFSKKVSK